MACGQICESDRLECELIYQQCGVISVILSTDTGVLCVSV